MNQRIVQPHELFKIKEGKTKGLKKPVPKGPIDMGPPPQPIRRLHSGEKK
jgi:hypothetical protein